MAKSVSILGSTGSIGKNALKVILTLSDQLEVKYLTAGRNWEALVGQAQAFHPAAVCIADRNGSAKLESALAGTGIEILSGREGVLEIAGRDDVDICLNALVGSAGMEPTICALNAGVDVALSNKESLVMAGGLIGQIKREKGGEIYPVDSEHSAIWQCLAGEDVTNIRRLILTGSGGPFREMPLSGFSAVTAEQALNHPNWKMGDKITIDSATMMNKGLEVIEAHWLFNLNADQIDIVVHPQSIIHSMVEFTDGSIKAQLGLPDMKIPIQYALTYPRRFESEWEEVDFPAISPLTFDEPDLEKFPCIRLAYDALERGGSAPAALNVVNDNTVKQFLDGQIGFNEIAEINGSGMEEHEWAAAPDLEYLLELERWGERFVKEKLERKVTV
ncbi:MAG: 1-deoxy-D-xylulose-5-phosphate reductoisomerase [Candidatus Marinimicrobia bacterium]|jgi:1-deoxy-D-xylulose-5-phosphate reductoisomerase|nr:1-deoxy-D-xylulose-5-phosphate reductoisomerase [Candidatus Neomarinimicrobiota bacterium]MDP6594062.1 1-deoxy-D-xylulose-5-phosphate reductoisomerase [Candidatus Neomarinimicrobiota bacterium]MDP6836549.1 1-deoxy-D-xylulose-5-phosphate reductoisomerase [Candidatus Neomarinimicrobiota bacterium]MDP6967085.1 1-deoxy-D-xylulose-5-phosphate reductoisomerase [Candidatus Neomarinimicrobiota bacterium]|tara:strand:- start:966 stop:2132 length:1167 start_codon:yes stop_codon:yes gene_type:complete